MEIEVNCPRCDEPIGLEGYQTVAWCPKCKADLVVGHDREYIDGVQRDWTLSVKEDTKHCAVEMLVTHVDNVDALRDEFEVLNLFRGAIRDTRLEEVDPESR
jgi:hypothetical protein